MPASYPSSIKTFTRKRDLLDIVLAADINQVYDEITSVQTVLGAQVVINVGWTSGSFNQSTLTWPSLRERIQNIEFGLFEAFNDRVKASGGTVVTPAGTSTVNLALRARTNQTADLFQAQNSASSVITRINSSGKLQLNTADVPSVSSTDTFTNKTISGLNNTLVNISPSSVVVAGSTDIQEFVEARPTVFYQATAPIGVIPGTIWVDSSQNVDPFDASSLLLSSDPSVPVGTMGFRRVNASTSAPTSSDGANGDVWLQYI
jgi:hypothetical protein